MSTQDVLNHHLESFSAGSIDGIMQDYTENSVLVLPDTTLRGLDAIRAGFSSFFVEGGLFYPGTYDFSMDRVEIEGEIAYIIWHAKTTAGEIPVGTDTFLVRDGKIAVQTFAMHMIPAS